MKKLILLSLLLFSVALFPAIAQQTKSKSERKITVAPTWYVTDVDGFQLIFADREGRIENLIDLKNQTPLRKLLADPAHDPEIVIVKDDKFKDWRLAETLEETRSENQNSVSNTVIRKRISEIVEYKRTGRN